MKTVLTIFATVGIAVLAAGHSPSPGWPPVVTPFYHAADRHDRAQRLAAWQARGMIVGSYKPTGSMRPVLQDKGEAIVLAPPRDLRVGQMVVFYRESDKKLVLHYIAAMSRDKSSVLTSGTNCLKDGWTSTRNVLWVVQEIVD